MRRSHGARGAERRRRSTGHGARGTRCGEPRAGSTERRPRGHEVRSAGRAVRRSYGVRGTECGARGAAIARGTGRGAANPEPGYGAATTGHGARGGDHEARGVAIARGTEHGARGTERRPRGSDQGARGARSTRPHGRCGGVGVARGVRRLAAGAATEPTRTPGGGGPRIPRPEPPYGRNRRRRGCAVSPWRRGPFRKESPSARGARAAGTARRGPLVRERSARVASLWPGPWPATEAEPRCGGPRGHGARAEPQPHRPRGRPP